MNDLGKHFGGLLYQAELDYLVEHEWARTAEDVLWRRSKKGLQLSTEKIADVIRRIESGVLVGRNKFIKTE